MAQYEGILLGIIASVMIPLLIICYCRYVVLPFVEELRYIKMEIDRTDGREREFWRRKLKKLYIKHIPVLNWFITKT